VVVVVVLSLYWWSVFFAKPSNSELQPA